MGRNKIIKGNHQSENLLSKAILRQNLATNSQLSSLSNAQLKHPFSSQRQSNTCVIVTSHNYDALTETLFRQYLKPYMLLLLRQNVILVRASCENPVG